jgi:hypothetical protein
MRIKWRRVMRAGKVRLAPTKEGPLAPPPRTRSASLYGEQDSRAGARRQSTLDALAALVGLGGGLRRKR